MRFAILYCILFLLTGCGQHREIPEQVTRAIEEVRSAYVKDKRTALFDVVASWHNDQLLLKGETIFPEAKKELMVRLGEQSIDFVDSLLILPSSDLEGKHFGVVTLSVCNIRSNPRHSAELATQALLGTPLRIYRKEGGFYYVQTPDDYLGWLDEGGFALMDRSAYSNWMQSERVVCMKDYQFIYARPDEHSGKVTDLLAGNILQKTGEMGTFTAVTLPDGREGFVPSRDCMDYRDWLATRKAKPESVLENAREFLGRPYLWGGTSGKGMDCSGFTKTVYLLNGIQLERDASLQVHNGEPVPTDTTWQNLEPGDLLFFGRKASEGKKERITHVAIYMGKGRIIHASERVKVESLRRGDPDFAEDRLNTFIRAKRVIGSEGKNGIVALKDSPFYAIDVE